MKRMKNILAAIIFSIVAIIPSRADEGMWIPLLIDELNFSRMQELGLKLSAEDIYSVNKGSMKDAIVSFGGFCTGSMISPEGLLLTNHHCGYGQIQEHSSVEHDYLKNGFWAMNKEEELANPGLTATFIVRIEDVTQKVLQDITEGATEQQRDSIISIAIDTLVRQATEGTHYGAYIRPFFSGNEYYLFVTETFRDVRLVGAPPSSIGKYGGDTDNWMWPRHTGDFALFRVYAGPDNNPADYSPDNVPYQPKHFLPASVAGIEEGDFTMVFGFPGRTEQYLPSFAVSHIVNVSNPAKIKIRERKLEIMERDMKLADSIRIKYAAKQSSVSNYYKKWIGVNRGLKQVNAVGKKEALEDRYNEWAAADATRVEGYGGIIDEYEKLYTELNEYELAYDYFVEAGLLSSDLTLFVYRFLPVMDMYCNADEEVTEEQKQAAQRFLARSDQFFKDFYLPTDKKIMAAMLETYNENIEEPYLPDIFHRINDKFDGDYQKYAEHVYDKTVFADRAKLTELFSNWDKTAAKKIMKDPAYQLTASIAGNYRQMVAPTRNRLQTKIDSLDRLYVAGLREMQKDRVFWPDANSTIRISFGEVKSYNPRDAIHYNYYTTMEGLMEKYIPEDDEFDLPPKLIELYKNKDYGKYSEDTTVIVNFIATNQTTGGNSGSPVINAYGHLIGLNFDSNWEGTPSDIWYIPEQDRNISVDIRYVLFVIDKFAGAEHLIKEMKIIESYPKRVRARTYKRGRQKGKPVVVQEQEEEFDPILLEPKK